VRLQVRGTGRDASGGRGPAFLAGALISLVPSWVLVSRLERAGSAWACPGPCPVTAAVIAMTGRQQRLGAGVVIGSNVFNLAAPPGLAAVAAGRIRLHPKVMVPGGAAAIRVAAVCLAVIPALVPPVAGLMMAFGAIALDAVALGEAAGSRPASAAPGVASAEGLHQRLRSLPHGPGGARAAAGSRSARWRRTI
jgi:hypothetical protein